jgi:ornithine--oxo-acid transaminase
VRYATGRPGIVYCDHAFDGLGYGALSLNADATFRDGFGPVPAWRNDLAALEIIESEGPVQNAARRDELVKDVRGKGLMLGWNLGRRARSSSRTIRFWLFETTA